MTLYIIGTPIGNLSDLSSRTREILAELDVLACEDTRHTGRLFQLAGIERKAQLIACHEHNEKAVIGRILSHLEAGQMVGLCSDAGYPLISDPGYPLVRAVIDAGYEISVIPGPSAICIALISSGLPPSSFTFKGFLPRKPGARRKTLVQELHSEHTLIFYESSYRITKTLKEMLEIYGDRKAALCLELTKQFERVERGRLSELLQNCENKKIKGEAVIVVAPEKFQCNTSDLN